MQRICAVFAFNLSIRMTHCYWQGLSFGLVLFELKIIYRCMWLLKNQLYMFLVSWHLSLSLKPFTIYDFFLNTSALYCNRQIKLLDEILFQSWTRVSIVTVIVQNVKRNNIMWQPEIIIFFVKSTFFVYSRVHKRENVSNFVFKCASLITELCVLTWKTAFHRHLSV